MCESVHLSVLPQQVVEYLALQPGQTVIDGTLGGGGHTRLLAEQVRPDGLVLALDRDAIAVERAERQLKELSVRARHANFCDAPEVLKALDLPKADGLLLDLGISSDQLSDAQRGFSFHSDGPFDLRFDPSRGEPAWRLLQRLSEKHLADLIYAFGEERQSRRVARALVAARQQKELRTASEIANVIRKAVRGPRERIDRATRTFQAFRIAVNEELKSLEIILRRAPECLHAGARIAIISFHSLEDRRVKDAFRENPYFETITGKPVRPTEDEIARNPRSRSARLRVARIIEDANPSFL